MQRQSKTDWNRFATLDDTDLETSDTGAEFWHNAQVSYPKRKKQVTLRIDADLLDWYRGQADDAHGKGYQTIIHTVLASYRQAIEQKR
ncbi:MAG: 3-oxoacyl-ACP synthase [Alphaproteobacteria bacterium]|nr:MAG: 3-oxoacyl-ACP synthase [Alphaproteobacteria bacterium]